MIYDAVEVAKWILCAAKRVGIYMTHMKLQKLLYYAQAYVLGMLGRPLFTNEMRAWQHGPVVIDVYNRYSRYGREVITDVEEVEIPEEYLALIKMLIADKGSYTASALRDMTHEEKPWNIAYFGGGSRIIKPEDIEECFAPQFWASDEEDEYQPSFATVAEEEAFLRSGISEEERNAFVKSR